MKICSRCVLPETFPGIGFDGNGVCNYCRENSHKGKDAVYGVFSREEDLITCLRKHKRTAAKYDVLVPVSGGVDSCAALIYVAEKFKLRPLAFHNDHGYEDSTATENVQKLCRALDLDLIIWQHDCGFMKKLWKFLNETRIEGLSGCYFCAFIIYLNAIELASKNNIPMVINGLNKGQAAIIGNKEKTLGLFEKLIPVISADRDFFEEFIRKNELLNKQRICRTRQDFERQIAPDEVMVIPFFLFAFYKPDKEELKKVCRERFDWQPMKTSYPNRTTNCDIVWLNTYMDLEKMGYTIYHEEYSNLIRVGENEREQAVKDLAFSPPPGLVERLAEEVGVDLEKFKTGPDGGSSFLEDTLGEVGSFDFEEQ